MRKLVRVIQFAMPQTTIVPPKEVFDCSNQLARDSRQFFVLAKLPHQNFGSEGKDVKIKEWKFYFIFLFYFLV